MRSSSIAVILRSLLGQSDPVRVRGAPTSARALIIARLVKFLEKPVVVICADDESAAEFGSDLENMASAIDGTVLPVILFPGWEQSPYSPIALSLKTRLARLAALSELSDLARKSPDTRSPFVVVTSLQAGAQATIPYSRFLSSSIALSLGSSVQSRGTLISSLLEIGYARLDSVEDPGSFAVRGEIVDIFPPNRSHPLRLELFDETIERIREFDPATQRALPEGPGISLVNIPPAREVLINSETTARTREKLKQFADDQGIPRSIRDPVLGSVQNGMYADHSDSWAPFAYENPGTLWDYLGTDWPIAWNDELSCNQTWDTFLKDQASLADPTRKTEVIVPPPALLFQMTPAQADRLKSQTRLYLDQVDIVDAEALTRDIEVRELREKSEREEPIQSRHLVAVKTNADLARGSRQSLGELEAHLKLWLRQGFRVVGLANTQSQLERIRFLLQERGIASSILLNTGTVTQGFRWPAEGLVVLTEDEILGTKHVKKASTSWVAKSGSAAKDWSGLSALSDLSAGDAIVHVDHGIGRYQGLVRLNLSGAPSDFLLLEYANKDRLYLPVYRLNVIQKYVGAGESAPLDRLGTLQFAKTKEKVRSAVKTLAVDLVQLYAERKIRPGVRFSPRDAGFQEFEAKFPFEETPDQSRSVDSILSDMESGRVMDRIVCGDVGYGKTEVAIRAAFRAVSDGKQVAILVPTTVLAYQHEQSFKARLQDYPFIIEGLSRFKSVKEQKDVIARIGEGKVDIVVGTHRLLSKDIRFKDLGLVVIDEEHRFGVEHKEKLKTLRINTHVLTLTATPIPRTLHMALAGLRDISLINTPPVDRLPIRTYVSKYDEDLIKRAVEFELSRGGQVFFLHNRVQTIEQVANKVRQLVPDARVSVGHGQMSEGVLEKTMIGFYKKQFNVLVCTTIIESGLDLPLANTILINRADTMGLAQLYQIRGRVGRGQQRAYAYLLLPAEGAISDDAKRRLEVIQRFVELGSGFSIANHDLEIRGGGDLLGPQQSGHIGAVGFDLYTELLEEAIHELQGKPLEPEESRREPEIKVPFAAYLDEIYVSDVHQRLSFYRRFSASQKEEDIVRLEEELLDRFGPLPLEAQSLLWLIRIKQLLKRQGLDGLTAGPARVSLLPGTHSRLDPVKAIALVASRPEQYQLLPDSKFVAKIPTDSLRDLFFNLEKLLNNLVRP
ncbi:MAG TPA: transcription-repair coupling factor [Bdellovibrionales bacterium]|nr:transcription-repair coupling factor [Bdellovibrionales bacterium]